MKINKFLDFLGGEIHMSKRSAILRRISVGAVGLALLMTGATRVHAGQNSKALELLGHVAVKPEVGNSSTPVDEVSSDGNGSITSVVSGAKATIEPNACTALGLSLKAGDKGECIGFSGVIYDGTGVFFAGTYSGALYIDTTSPTPNAASPGACFSGSAVVTKARQANATVTLEASGDACVLPNSPSYVTFDGGDILTVGTGPYVNAFGAGIMTIGIYASTGDAVYFDRGAFAHIN